MPTGAQVEKTLCRVYSFVSCISTLAFPLFLAPSLFVRQECGQLRIMQAIAGHVPGIDLEGMCHSIDLEGPASSSRLLREAILTAVWFDV